MKPNKELNPGSLITYDFPLRKDLLVQLYLPVNMTMKEAKRLVAYIESLAIPDTKKIYD